MRNKTLTLFGFFVCLGRQAGGSPLADQCITTEQSPPFRRGHGVLIRLPFTGKKPTTGIVFGRWDNQ